MQKSEIITLFEYNSWANQRVLNAASQISAEDYAADVDLSYGSIRGALVHTFSAEWVWRMRCQQGISPARLLYEADFPTLAELRERWDSEEQAMHEYLQTLTSEMLDGIVRYTNTQGIGFENTLWHILAHVVNHGTQFRGEAAIALTRLGHSPGDLDLISFLRNQ